MSARLAIGEGSALSEDEAGSTAGGGRSWECSVIAQPATVRNSEWRFGNRDGTARPCRWGKVRLPDRIDTEENRPRLVVLGFEDRLRGVVDAGETAKVGKWGSSCPAHLKFPHGWYWFVFRRNH